MNTLTKLICLLGLLLAVSMTTHAQPPPNGIPPNGIGQYSNPVAFTVAAAHVQCNGLQYCQEADPLPLVGAGGTCNANDEFVAVDYSENFYALGCSNMYMSASANYGYYYFTTQGTVKNPVYQYWLIHSWQLWTNCDSGGITQDYYDVYQPCTPNG